MNETTLIYVMTAFVIISAIALCIQAGMLAAMYKTTKALQEKVDPLVPKVDSLLPKVESLVEKTNSTVEQSGRQITEITTRANDILDSTKRQLAIVEDVVGDAAERAKVQMERVELRERPSTAAGYPRATSRGRRVRPGQNGPADN